MIDLLIDRCAAQQSLATLILAHGAGAPMDSDFMNRLTFALNGCDVNVVRFEFPYMRERRATGKKRPPDRQPVLLECWRSVCRQVAQRSDLPEPVFIGGKSMGGRMATLVAGQLAEDGAQPAGVCCFGYPFHPPGKVDKMRIEHLQNLSIPTVIIQGTRDPFGKPDELQDIPLGKQVSVHWLEAGDHDFKPTVRSGLTHSQHIETAAETTAHFIRSL